VVFAVFSWNAIQRHYFYPLKYKNEVFSTCDEFGVDKALVFAVIKTESGFDKDAVSNKGAVGLMQIKPSTAEYVAKKLGLTDYSLCNEKDNVRIGVFYLKMLIVKFGDVKTALCAYNAGEGNVSLWLKNSDYSRDGKTIFNVPFKETSDYLKKIEKSSKKYSKLYVNILDKQI
jgi:soluble lytic murein transglycosylase